MNTELKVKLSVALLKMARSIVVSECSEQSALLYHVANIFCDSIVATYIRHTPFDLAHGVHAVL